MVVKLPPTTFEYSSKTLSSNEVEYLVFEGGGGKGNVLPGAIRALEDSRLTGANGEPGILQTKDLKPRNIKGFAGASAGAINSLFLSCGFDGDEIDIIMNNQDFNEFFDYPVPGLVPTLANPGFKQKPWPEKLADLSDQIEVIMAFVSLLPDLKNMAVAASYSGKPLLRVSELLTYPSKLAGRVEQIMRAATQNSPDPYFPMKTQMLMSILALMLPQDKIDLLVQNTKNKSDTAISLVFDFGIMPGLKIREFFEKWVTIARYRVLNIKSTSSESFSYEDYRTKLGDRAYVAEGGKSPKQITVEAFGRELGFKGLSPDQVKSRLIQILGKKALIAELQTEYYAGNLDKYKGTTFAQHSKVFGVELVMTGTNLGHLKSEFFSAKNTPNCPVASVTRLSMSLPGFKPIRVEEDQELEKIMGNGEHPRIADNRLKSGFQEHYLKGVWLDGGFYNNIPLSAFEHADAGKGKSKTLGIRVGLEEYNEISNIAWFAKDGWPGSFFFGTGEAHMSVTRRNNWQTLLLDAGALSTFEFAPEISQLAPLIEDARRDTLKYFGQKP